MKKAKFGRRILVPVDFSEASIRALQHATKLIGKSNGFLTIVNVVPADYGWLGISSEIRQIAAASSR